MLFLALEKSVRRLSGVAGGLITGRLRCVFSATGGVELTGGFVFGLVLFWLLIFGFVSPLLLGSALRPSAMSMAIRGSANWNAGHG